MCLQGFLIPEIILAKQDWKFSGNLSSPIFNIESKLTIDNSNSFKIVILIVYTNVIITFLFHLCLLFALCQNKESTCNGFFPFEAEQRKKREKKKQKNV